MTKLVAAILFTALMLECILIITSYLNWSALAITFFSIILFFYCVLMFMILKNVIMSRPHLENGIIIEKNKIPWPWYISLTEILFCLSICIFLICLD